MFTFLTSSLFSSFNEFYRVDYSLSRPVPKSRHTGDHGDTPISHSPFLTNLLTGEDKVDVKREGDEVEEGDKLEGKTGEEEQNSHVEVVIDCFLPLSQSFGGGVVSL